MGSGAGETPSAGHVGRGGYDIGYSSSPCFWGTSPGSLVRHALRLLPDLKGVGVLDAGCGEGKNAAFLAAHGALVDAIDISHQAILNARSAWDPAVLKRIRFQVADVQDYVADREYDIVILYGLLHCIPGAAKRPVVENLKAITRAGGFHVVCALNDRLDGFTEGHRGFRPHLVGHGTYLGLYSDWTVAEASDLDLTECHPPEFIEHTHAVSRFFALSNGRHVSPELRVLYQEDRLIPFVGAGISAGVTWDDAGVPRRGPTWSELVDQAARLIGFEDAELLRVRGTDLQILEYFRLKKHEEIGELVGWLLQHMKPSDDELRASPVHARLAELDKCQLIYTTNYDDFIERALLAHGRPCTRIAIEGHIADALKHRAEAGERTCEVVKFHGDLTATETMVLSDSDYERRLTLQTALDHRLRSDVLGRAVLFLGYSFRDWNVSYLFRLVNDAFEELPASSLGRRAYIAVPDPSDFEFTLFRARNIEVIPVNGHSQTEDIAELLHEIREPVGA